MPSFESLIENLRAEEADVARLWAADERPLPGRSASPERARRVTEAAIFYADVLAGRRRAWHFEEAMTTSDFPTYFGAVLDRQVLDKYDRITDSYWRNYAREVEVADFRTQELVPPLILPTGRLPQVLEKSEYTETKVDEQARPTWKLAKYGLRFAYSFEANINDNLRLLRDVPDDLAQMARTTEDRMVMDLFVDGSGPHASLYTTANKNRVHAENGASASNPPLSESAMEDALLVLSRQVDEAGQPIRLSMITLVVPPALEIRARKLLESTTLETTAPPGKRDAGAGETRLIGNNWMRGRFKLVVDPFIPTTAITANGNTSWFLFADPTKGRPAIQLGKLRGHTAPELRMKASNSKTLSGAPIGEYEGDFDTDGIQFRCRHILGSVIVSAKMTVASNGSGS